MCVRFLARLVVVFFFLLSSLQRLSAAEPGDLISTSHVGSYSVSALEALNDEFYQLSALGYLIQDVPDAGVRYAVDVYRVEYYTSDFNGALVIGSGLYADPVTNRLEHVILYTHGTSVTIWDTPSNVSGEAFDGPTVLINLAGRGGLKLLMPDGTGFWTSTVRQHRYLMGEVEGRTAIDMWTAVQQSSPFLREPPQGDLHLFGLSAGALPALWAQRLYEANGGTLAEVTLMGAVTDPETFIEESLGKVGRYYHVYDAFAFEAWINTSRGAVSASSVFKDPSSIASLFDMDHSYTEVIEGLKNTAGATYLPGFLHDFQRNVNHPARVFLRASDATVGWCPKAPIIFHHFEEDTEVSFDSAIAAQAALNTCAGSGGATLVRYDSTAVPLLAYPGAEHLELGDNLFPKYADGTLPGLTW
ncbi:MAG TPA: hypothetical protein VIZ32_10895 [Vicinamibacterales bacterium]